MGRRERLISYNRGIRERTEGRGRKRTDREGSNFAQDVLGAQEVLGSLTSLKRDCSKEELLGEMLKIVLKYSGAQKGTFLVGESFGKFGV
jgi:hypothetical protein